MSTLIASTAERNRQKRQMAEQAIKLAMQNQWQEAVDLNRQIIELVPEEPDAWNRLGKAFSELGQYGDARDAYQEALNRDANNSIAQKQLKRLALLAEAEPSPDAKPTKLDPKLLIEETGKTGIFELVSPAAPAALARMAAGDKVNMRIDGNDVVIEDHRGRVLGMLPPRIAVRLVELMNGGNAYVAGVTNVSEKQIRVLVREMRQSAQMDGRVSFPSKSGPLPPELRAYTKDRAVRFDVDDDDFMGDDTEDETEEVEAEGDGDSGEEAEQTTSDIEYYEDRDSSSSE